MKNFTLKAIVVGTSLTLALTGFVYAKSNDGGNQNNTRQKQFTVQNDHEGQRNGKFGHKKELTEEQKAAMIEKAKTALSEKLAAGTITQEQYDTALAEIEAGKMPEILRGTGFGRPELTEEQKAAMIEKAKSALSEKLAAGTITQEQYDAALAEIEAGKMPEILRGTGFGRPELTEEQKAAMIEKAKAALSEKLAAGTITQEQYDAAIAEIEAGKIPEILCGTGFGRPELTEEQKAAMIEKAKTILSEKLAVGTITQEQYDAAIAEIEAGKMPEILRGTGIGRPELTEEQKAAMFEKAKTILSEKLADGTITQEQYDAALAKIEAGDFPAMFGKGKFGGAPGFGRKGHGMRPDEASTESDTTAPTSDNTPVA